LLVGKDLAVGKAAVAVDSGVHEGVADLGAMPAASLRSSTVDPPAAPLGDPAKLLDVDVDEFAGTAHLHPSDRGAGHPVQVVETVQLVSD
jgi:hypothetical protein